MNRLNTTLCLSLAVFFTACSSDSGDDNPAPSGPNVAGDSGGDGSSETGALSTGGAGDDSGNSVASSCSDSQSFDIPDNPITTATSSTITRESGADGDILFDCKGQRFSLTPGINSLDIVDVLKQDDIDFSCSNGNRVNANAKYDYRTGGIAYTGTLNGQTFSCNDTYTSPLDTVVSDDASTRKLLLDWGNTDDDFISTTCPNDEDELDDDFDPITCSGTFSSNYTMMDSAGKTHRLSTKTTVSFQ